MCSAPESLAIWNLDMKGMADTLCTIYFLGMLLMLIERFL